MALRGHEAGWPCGRASGDTPRQRCLQGDAGEVGPQRRPQDRATDAARLVPAGTLQVDHGPAMLLAIAVFSWFGVTTPDRTAEQSFMSRAEARHQGVVTVRAAVLSDDESQRYFGASLADHGIQAIWLSVNNASDSLLEFLPIVTDPNYFSEAEVEQLLRAWWRGSANASIKAAVAQAPVPGVIPQKQTAPGFV